MYSGNRKLLVGRFIILGILGSLAWTSQVGVLADSLFLHRNAVEDPSIPRLTRQEITSRLERQLFDLPTSSSISYFFDGGNFRPVTFATDLGWNRICYYDRYWTWIKAYGESEAEPEHDLHFPLDVCSNNGDGLDGSNIAYVFVLDGGSQNRILRLRYDHNDGSMVFDDSLTLDSDDHGLYRYFCMHDGGTIGQTSDDYLWVVDRYYGKIVKYNARGAPGVQRTHVGTRGSGVGEIGSFGDIVCGRNPVDGENNNYIYLLDEANQRVVRLYDNGVNLIYDGCYESGDFCGLGSITADVYGQIYVVENFAGRIWKFTSELDLLGVFDPGGSSPDGLVNPVSISSAMGTPNNPGWADLFVCEEYTDTSGGQWYQIGLKLIWQWTPIISDDEYSITIPYSASDPHLLSVKVWKMDTQWMLIDSWEEPRYSGQSEVFWEVFDTGQSADYRFEVTGLSTYQNVDGDPLDQFQFALTRNFGNQHPVVTQYVRVGEYQGCVEYCTDGLPDTATVQAYDPEGLPLVYDWYCDEGSFDYWGGPKHSHTAVPHVLYFAPPAPLGRRSHRSGADPISAEPDTIMPHELKVVITDQGGARTSPNTSFIFSWDCDQEGCPTVHVKTANGYQIDNNVLSASEDTAQAPGLLTDTYLLRLNPQKGDDGYIHLQLREDETEITKLDAVELVTAWVDPRREIGISDRGTLFYPSLVSLPISVVDGSGTDRLSELEAKDGNKFVSYGPGELIVNFGKVRESGLSKPVADCPDPCEGVPFPPPEKKAYRISPYADLAGGNILRVEVMDESGEWAKAGIIPPRKLPVTRYLQLGGWVKNDQDLWLRLRWDQAYSIDHLGYYRFDTEGITMDKFAPSAVSHSSLGDVRDALTSASDKATTTLSPGEILSFTFGPIPDPPPGKVAKYILICTGRYKINESTSVSSPAAPDGSSLDQNAPNPFNEGTTISYSLAHDGPVRLEVYNVLGRRVKTLVDGFQSAGRHNVRWDGRDHRGRPAASGVYFYRLTAGKFTESRKMILMK